MTMSNEAKTADNVRPSPQKITKKEPWRLPPEFAPQAAVMIAWPHAETDWSSMLEAAELNFSDMIAAISQTATPWILIPDEVFKAKINKRVQTALESHGWHQHFELAFSVCHYNDTWTRDYGPLCVFKASEQIGQKHLRLQDFVFNGWGNKFDATGDNTVNQTLWEAGEFERIYTSQLDQQKLFSVQLQQHETVLEGGSLETNGRLLLSTTACLLNPNRNPDVDQATLEELLKKQFGSKAILWLSAGHLQGDDTDAHIDTLARFVNDTTLAFQGCDDTNDEHYNDLQMMKQQLQILAQEHTLTLIELPWPTAQYEDGRRLPATYANFLILNELLLLPTYSCEADALAIDALKNIHTPSQHSALTIVPIDCRTLIRNNGSLHCSTMQLPHIWSRS